MTRWSSGRLAGGRGRADRDAYGLCQDRGTGSLDAGVQAWVRLPTDQRLSSIGTRLSGHRGRPETRVSKWAKGIPSAHW